MIRKFISIILASLSLGLFLSACTSEESLNERWHTTAEEEGVILQSIEGYHLLFSSEGMTANYPYGYERERDVFPFQDEELYSEYEIHQDENSLIIQVGNDDELQYKLTIVGDRLFEDESKNISYTTDSYLLDAEQEQDESTN